MMILKEAEVCHLGTNCPYNQPYGTCYGVRKDRDGTFECAYVINGQIIHDAGTRHPMDKTGKMKVIME